MMLTALTGRVRQTLHDLRHGERAQGLVEYALIIVVVSLGTIAALTFMRDEIRSLFSRAGSSLQVGAGASSGGGGGGGGGPVITITQQPADGTTATTATFQFTSSPAATSYQCAVSGTGGSSQACTPSTNVVFNGLAVGSHTLTVTPTPAGTNGTYTWTIAAPSFPSTPTQVSSGTWYSPGGDVNGGPDNYQGLDGVYTDNGGPVVGSACSFTVSGSTFSGVWIYHDTGPGNDQWEIDGDGSSSSYEWACLNVPAPPVPQPGTVAISSPYDATPDDGDTLRATASGFTNSPTSYEFEWQADNVGSDSNCTNASFSGVYSTDQHSGGGANVDEEGAVDNTGNRYCYRVRARAENSNGWGPFSPYSGAFWVDD
jgi:Flp pilus assembly pilin Flp